MSKWPNSSQHLLTTFGGLSRSKLMSRIRRTGNATTELRLVKLLRAAKIGGWRRNYPLRGKPDFVFPEVRLAVFVDGCFWHGHVCGRNLTPKRNAKTWQEKIDGNRRRDRQVTRYLRQNGWRVVRIWECMLRRKPDVALSRIRGMPKKCLVERSVRASQSRRFPLGRDATSFPP